MSGHFAAASIRYVRRALVILPVVLLTGAGLGTARPLGPPSAHPGRHFATFTFTPDDGATFTDPDQHFSVQACDEDGIDTIEAWFNGSPVGYIEGEAPNCTGAAGSLDVTLHAGANTFGANACGNNGCDYQQISITYTPPVTYGITLTANQGSVTFGEGGSANASFTVTNTGTGTGTVLTGASCYPGSCSNPGSVELAPNASTTITTTLSGSVGGSGSVSVSAWYQESPTTSASASTNVTITTPPPTASFGSSDPPGWAGSTTTVHFNVGNPSTYSRTFNLSTSCGIVTCSGPSSVTVSASSQQSVAYTYAAACNQANQNTTLSLTATQGSLSATASQQVTIAPNAYATGTSVALGSSSIMTTQTMSATATVTSACGTTLTGHTISWSSNNTGVATVDASGNLTPHAAGTATITGTSNHLVTGGIDYGGGQSGSQTLTVTWAPYATVTPSPASPAAGSGTSVALKYAVKNTGNGQTTYTLAVTNCPSSVVNGSCTPSKTSTTLSPSAVDTILVTFTAKVVSQNTTGTVSLRASAGGTTLATGNASLTIGLPTIVATSAGLNPQGSIARDQCLTIALSEAAAYECGDLRVVHALPSVRTMNRQRTPTLVYNSRQQSPVALIATNVTASFAAPDSITATLNIAGLILTQKYAWNTSCAGIACRLVFPVDAVANALSTGWYRYTIQMSMVANGQALSTAPDSGSVTIVNRRSGSDAIFGQGWWLDGLEQLKDLPAAADSIRKLWIGGDGNTRVYVKASGDTFVAQDIVDRPDTLLRVDTLWRRLLPGGGYVQFDHSGRHVATVNAAGHTTTFAWNGTKLTTITLPVPSGSTAPSYTFAYNATPMVTSVTAPGPTSGTTRTDTLTQGSTGVIKIKDPDLKTTTFTYTTNRMSSRGNKLSDTVTFTYTTVGNGLRYVTRKMRGAAALVTTICPAETRSLAVCTGGGSQYQLQPLTNTYTRFYDPLNHVTQFFVNRFGAPDKIVDALNHTTTIWRDATFPALADSMQDVAGHKTKAVYNARGLPTTVTDVAPYGGSNAVTTYKYNAKWPVADTVTSPTGQVTYFGTDASTGNRLWQRLGTNDSTKVLFTYDSYNRPATVQEPHNDASHKQVLAYDGGLGNLSSLTSALGFVTSYRSDAIGRVDTVTSPIDGTRTRMQVSMYDIMDRDTLNLDIGQAVSYSIGGGIATDSAPAVTLSVQTVYDAEGRPTAVTRRSVPDLASVGALADSWTYDAVGRKLTHHGDRVESWAYDAAGNVTTWTTGRYFNITTGYDVLNRPIWRVTPSVTYDEERGAGAGCSKKPVFPWFSPIDGEYVPSIADPCDTHATPWTAQLVIPRDSVSFTYDAAGRVLTAYNNDAHITREYFPNGALKRDEERVAADSLLVGNAVRFDLHVYRSWYTYDLSGRRLTRTDTLPGCTGCVQSYHYESVAGRLDSTYDRGSPSQALAAFGFGYDRSGRLWKVQGNGTRAVTTFTYDPDSRLTSRSVSRPGVNVYYDDLTYDQANRIVTTSVASDLPAIADATEQVYNGLGALAAVSRERGGAEPVDGFKTDAFGNRALHKSWAGDGGGALVNGYLYAGEHLFEVNTDSTWHPGEEAPVARLSTLDTTSTVYDGSGNVHSTMRTTSLFTNVGGGYFADSLTGREWSWNAYDANERLMVSQRSFLTSEGLRTLFSEYHYDALGRRVVIRTRWDQNCNNHGHNWECLWNTERTAWDGDQVLTEMRGPATTEQEYSTGYDFRGVVRYTHAGGLDEPLALWRQDGSAWSGLVPHRSWRGTYEEGSYLDDVNKVNVAWTARTQDIFYAPDSRVTPVEPSHWLGSLVEGKTDPNGLQYMRNRYYDPATGRFTQQDPIGLAGGMNLYGFVAGDPVNYGDPFGLKGCDDKEGDAKAECERHEKERREAQATCKADAGQFGLSLATNVLGIGAIRYLRAFADVTRTAKAADVALRTGVGVAAAATAEQEAAGALIGNAMYLPTVMALKRSMAGSGTRNELGGTVGLLYDLAKVAPVIGAGLELGEAIRSCGAALR